MILFVLKINKAKTIDPVKRGERKVIRLRGEENRIIRGKDGQIDKRRGLGSVDRIQQGEFSFEACSDC